MWTPCCVFCCIYTVLGQIYIYHLQELQAWTNEFSCFHLFSLLFCSTVLADKLRGFTTLPWQCRGSSQCTEELSRRFPTPPRSCKDLLFFNNKDIIYKTLKGILLFKNSPGAQVFWVLVQYDNIENIYFFWILWLNCYNLSQYLKLKAFDERLKK